MTQRPTPQELEEAKARIAALEAEALPPPPEHQGGE